MEYLARLAMHDGRSPYHSSSKSRPDRLVSKTYSQDRNLAGHSLYGFHYYTRILRTTRSGRNHDTIGMHRFDIIDSESVVPKYLQLLSHLPKVLDEIEGERIVVIDDENHFDLRLTIYD